MTQKIIYRVIADGKIIADFYTKQLANCVADDMKNILNYKIVRVKKIILK